jgi:Icc-related predicted phosphoesterase
LEVGVKLWILSDLHLEFSSISLPEVEADVVILAGDIDVEGNGLEWALETFPNTPVLYVLGNHEYYGNGYPKHLYDLKEKAENTNVKILENDAVTIGDITFLGCSLWTDFNLYGNPKVAGYEATQIMADYKKIRLSPHYSKLRSLDTASIYHKSVRWLKSQFDEIKTKKVVITHHAPSEQSVPPQYKGDIVSAAFASRLETLVESSNAALWVHGHMHSASHYLIGRTRVLYNPRGYPGERGTNFIPDLSVEL